MFKVASRLIHLNCETGSIIITTQYTISKVSSVKKHFEKVRVVNEFDISNSQSILVKLFE